MLRVATLDEIRRYGAPGARERGLLPPIKGAAGPALYASLGGWCGASAATSLTGHWPVIVPAGSRIVVVAGAFVSAGIGSSGLTFSDSRGYTWRKVIDAVVSTAQTAIFTTVIGSALTTTDSFTVSWTAGGTVNNLAASIGSFTGAGGAPYAAAATAGIAPSGVVTTSASVNAGDLVVYGNWNGVSAATGVGTGWTIFETNNTPALKTTGGYIVPTSAGAVTGGNEQATIEGSGIVAFAASGGGQSMMM